MSAPTTATKAAVAAAVSAAVIGILYLGTRTSTLSADKHRATIDWPADAGPRAGARCLTQLALITPAALAIAGLDARGPDGGVTDQYVWVRACANVDADGGLEEPPLPGMEALSEGQEESAYDGGPQISIVLDGEAEMLCACSTGTDCEMRQAALGCDGGWMPAWRGNTLGAGQWRGTGCHSKACVELAGRISSWPEECPAQ